jgi:hypothetical protein
MLRVSLLFVLLLSACATPCNYHYAIKLGESCAVVVMGKQIIEHRLDSETFHKEFKECIEEEIGEWEDSDG